LNASANRVFISYRRDDAAGYAGRLEEALERRLGQGSVFRDVLDIAPGEDFVAAIRAKLASAHTVLVLIGPRWAGGDVPGRRRIDDPQDFVHLEVSMALLGGLQVVPVLLPGAQMPGQDSLPEALKPLALRNAINLGDAHWAADVERLTQSIGAPPRRALWPWVLGGVLLAAALAGAWFGLRPDPTRTAGERLIGSWSVAVRYEWGDRYTERFEFKHHAGELTGTASFLGYPRAIENLRLDGTNLRFETHSDETMGDSTKTVTHGYAAELRGVPPDEVLAIRMQTTGAHGSRKPLEFEARRTAPASAASR
jgi:TIR domain